MTVREAQAPDLVERLRRRIVDREAAPALLRKLRRRIIEVAASAREGHVPSALSILDIIWVLYDRVLNIDPAKPDDEGRDRFVLSKDNRPFRKNFLRFCIYIGYIAFTVL